MYIFDVFLYLFICLFFKRNQSIFVIFCVLNPSKVDSNMSYLLTYYLYFVYLINNKDELVYFLFLFLIH